MNDVIQQAIQFVTETPIDVRITVGFVSGMLLIFGWALLHFLGPLWSKARAFGKASESLDSAGSPEFPSDSPFPKKHKPLRRLWSSYKKRYTRASVELDGSSLSPIAPEEVFSRDRVFGGFNRGLAIGLAGVFAGLGILGTFTGLLIGLEGVDTSTADQLLDSVTGLLGGMSTAFYSSIAGIFLSLVWLALDRWAVNKVDRAARTFFTTVRSRWPVTSSDRIAFRVAALQTEQKTILQNLGTDLSQAFRDAIDKSFSQELSPALDSIDETLQSVASDVRDEQVEAMDELAEAFQERLLGSVNEQFGELQQTLEETTEWQKQVTEDVGSVFEQVSELSEMNARLLENSSEAAEKFLSSVDQLSESHERIGETSERLEEVARQTGTLAEQLESQVEVFQDSNEEIREQLANQLDSVHGQVQELEEFWADLQTDLQRLSTNLSETLTELTAQTEDRLSQVFERFDGEMGTIVEHLSGTLHDMREVNQEIVPAVQRIETALDETLEPIHGAKEEAGELAESIRSLDRLPGELRSASEEIGGARSSLDDLGDNLEELNQRLVSLSENGETPDENDQDGDPSESGKDGREESGGSFSWPQS